MKITIIRRSALGYVRTVAQTSQSVVSPVSKPASPSAARPTWKSGLRQAWLGARSRGPTATRSLTRRVAAICLALATCAAISARAQVILSTVPMQGGMLMPEIFYHAETDSVTVDLSLITEIAQLTPLLISNPTNRFDPADPWYDCLDPSRQGLAFSRRYGFTPAEGTGTLPNNRQLWIRKLSGSPNLGIYDYRPNSTPKRWTPIFGTAGSSYASPWSGSMWHVGVTAPPGTNTYAATFEVFVVNTDTALEVPGSGSGPFVLNWTDVPDGRPQLDITVPAPGLIQLAWPATATNWTLVSTPTPTTSSWSDVTNQPVVLDGQRTVTLQAPGVGMLFRMRYTL